MTTNDALKLKCTACEHPADLLAWRCAECGAPLDIVDTPAFAAGRINTPEWSLWALRGHATCHTAILVGRRLDTPLPPVELDGFRFHAKLESLNPTGSYKDRGTVTLVNHLLAHNISEVVEDSSGNAGASLAAYCRRNGHPCADFRFDQRG